MAEQQERKVSGQMDCLLEHRQSDEQLLDESDAPELAALQGTPDNQQEECSNAVDLRREDHRLHTLRDWPIKFLSAESTARDGLYYFGVGDALRCHFCGAEHAGWRAGDDVEAVHRRQSPDCPFLLRKHAGNVPSGRDERDTLGAAGRPAQPAYRTEQARFDSFCGWPTRMRQTPAALAEAGFYYTGRGDQAVCFFCRGGLQDWEDDDDPWEEHARWFSNCPYLGIVKGQDYIREINSKFTSRAPEPAPG